MREHERDSGIGNRESGSPRFSFFRFPIADCRFPLLALSLASCVSVLPDAPPPSARYLVNDVTIEAGVAPVAWTLAVEEPEATLAYNTAKIALTRAPGRIEYYSGGEWVDRAPRLFGVALVRSFENTGAVKGVGSRLTLPVSTYVLQTDVRRLGVVHEGRDKRAEVAVFARLTNGRSAIHASKLFSATAPIGPDTPAAAAAALDTSLTAIQREIVAWTLAEAARMDAAKAR